VCVCVCVCVCIFVLLFSAFGRMSLGPYYYFTLNLSAAS